jgi:hypothetical protein
VGAGARGALVVVAVVLSVGMTIVEVVDVILMDHGQVPAVRAVGVGVALGEGVCGRHLRTP